MSFIIDAISSDHNINEGSGLQRVAAPLCDQDTNNEDTTSQIAVGIVLHPLGISGTGGGVLHAQERLTALDATCAFSGCATWSGGATLSMPGLFNLCWV